MKSIIHLLSFTAITNISTSKHGEYRLSIRHIYVRRDCLNRTTAGAMTRPEPVLRRDTNKLRMIDIVMYSCRCCGWSGASLTLRHRTLRRGVQTGKVSPLVAIPSSFPVFVMLPAQIKIDSRSVEKLARAWRWHASYFRVVDVLQSYVIQYAIHF